MLQTCKKIKFSQRVMGLLVVAALSACAHNQGKSDLVVKADRLRAQGDDTGAAGLYQQDLQTTPDDSAAHQGLASILEAHGDYAGAARQYQAALAVQPDNADLLRGYGRVLLKQGNAPAAKTAYEQALQQDSDDVKALNGLGIALDMMGNHTAAQQTYQRALSQQPDDEVTLNNFARSYILAGAYQDAVHLLEPHARDKQAPPLLRQNLAEAYAMLGMDADAERMLRPDFSAADIKRKIAAYHAQRAKVAPPPKLYAELGSFPTEAMAQARIDAVKAAAPETEGLILTVTPAVKTIGGTPRFNVTVTGFAQGEHLRRLCAKLNATNLACHPHGI